MSPRAQRARVRRWSDVEAAVDAAARELPGCGMYLDPRLELTPARAAGGRVLLVLGQDWSAPASARRATQQACAAAGLPAALGACASVVAMRTASSAVASGCAPVCLRVHAEHHGVYVSLRTLRSTGLSRARWPPTSPLASKRPTDEADQLITEPFSRLTQ